MNHALRSHTSNGEDMETAVSKLVEKLSHYLPKIDITETITQVMSNFASQGHDVVLLFTYFSSAFENILGAIEFDYERMTSMSPELEKHVLKVLGDHLQRLGCTFRCLLCGVILSNATEEDTQDRHTSNHCPGQSSEFAYWSRLLVTSTDKFLPKDDQVKMPMNTIFKNIHRLKTKKPTYRGKVHR